MELNITADQAVQALVIVIAVAIVVTKLIDGLMKAGAIKDGDAGTANQVIALVVAAAGFLLRYFGQAGKVAEAETLGLELAAALVSSYVISFLAWLIHEQIVKRIEGRKLVSGPK